MTETPSTPSRSAMRVRRTASRVVSAPVPAYTGTRFADVGHRRGDHFLLLALVECVELAVGAEHEDAVYALGDEVIDEPLEAAAGRGPRWPAWAWRRVG